MAKWRELETLAWNKLEANDLEGATEAALGAINVEPNTIDSYLILAQASEVPGQRQAYAREAVRLGELKFQDEIISAPSDDFPFWEMIETRPYLRGLHILALSLWDDDRKDAKDEAIEIAQRMLRICPNDNIGVRFLLSEWLARQGQWSLGRDLLTECRDTVRMEMNMWAALYAYQNGDRDGSKERIELARKSNMHIVGQLLLKRHPKRPNGGWVRQGSIEEANSHASQAYDLWRSLAGAEEWLNQFSQR